MYRTFQFSMCAMVLLISLIHADNEQANSTFGRLPKSFDPPFAPQNINPDTATISLSPGFEKGCYDIHISLSETTLSEGSHKPARNYRGEFILQRIKLPTDDFHRLMGREFKNAADKQSDAAIEFTQVSQRDEETQTPFGQQYPVIIQSIRFGQVQRYVIYAELFFQVDFGFLAAAHGRS